MKLPTLKGHRKLIGFVLSLVVILVLALVGALTPIARDLVLGLYAAFVGANGLVHWSQRGQAGGSATSTLRDPHARPSTEAMIERTNVRTLDAESVSVDRTVIGERETPTERMRVEAEGTGRVRHIED